MAVLFSYTDKIIIEALKACIWALYDVRKGENAA